ncbi:MAG TPA: metallophosphoesterase [Actinophytocola sp.]|uniref:metallophosphoesterase n=1 Tax=Actinophytocola sp. TaxID=1872138 RepID=UPI002DDD2A00|nr:metallophosphoesterase [Actinophytocola sp.]HEV2780274.1 metallophosphoesterase [Actinophytocola sp.]
MIVLAHLSDIHIDLGDRNQERAERVMRYLAGLPGRLDAILVTGDLADHGLPAEYEQVATVLTTSRPVLTCPGNHDDRATYRKALLDEPADNTPINRAHRVAGALFLLCDSSIPGRDDGFLADETLAWIEATLATDPDAPAFICFHHPPIPLHAPFVDRIRQTGEQRLAGLVSRHPNVVALLCGHAHTAAASTFAGRPLLVAPGVVSTLTLPWEAGGPLDLVQPPAIAFHILADDRRLTTHYRVIP